MLQCGFVRENFSLAMAVLLQNSVLSLCV